MSKEMEKQDGGKIFSKLGLSIETDSEDTTTTTTNSKKRYNIGGGMSVVASGVIFTALVEGVRFAINAIQKR